jgi:hypothetical protein
MHMPRAAGMSAPLPLRCARCQQPVEPKDAREVGEEQGTSANLVFVHKGGCKRR